MGSPKISIVTVTYNCVNILEETILSVINQTYPNIEYILIDGGSKDGTMNIIRKYTKNITFWRSEPDSGIYDAMNKGTRIATGDWILFMNAGDSFANNFVLFDIFNNNTIDEKVGVIHGDFIADYGNYNHYIKQSPFYKSRKKIRGMGFSHQSVFVRLFLAQKILFNLKYKLSADYDMIWSLYYKYKVNFMQINVPISVMKKDDGTTERFYRQHLDEVCRICCHNKKTFHSYIFIYKNLLISLLRLLKRKALK